MKTTQPYYKTPAYGYLYITEHGAVRFISHASEHMPSALLGHMTVAIFRDSPWLHAILAPRTYVFLDRGTQLYLTHDAHNGITLGIFVGEA